MNESGRIATWANGKAIAIPRGTIPAFESDTANQIAPASHIRFAIGATTRKNTGSCPTMFDTVEAIASSPRPVLIT